MSKEFQELKALLRAQTAEADLALVEKAWEKISFIDF